MAERRLGKILLFSDHTWFYCYENQVKESIANHKWRYPDDLLKYVIIYGHNQEHEFIKIKE